MTILSTLSNFITAAIAPTTTRSMSVEQSSSTSFATLPEEVIVKILEQCDSKAVLACQLVRVLVAVKPLKTSHTALLTIFNYPPLPFNFPADMPRSQRRGSQLG
jgi:hypothetical protein